jgi:hypothetical protein
VSKRKRRVGSVNVSTRCSNGSESSEIIKTFDRLNRLNFSRFARPLACQSPCKQPYYINTYFRSQMIVYVRHGVRVASVNGLSDVLRSLLFIYLFDGLMILDVAYGISNYTIVTMCKPF